MTAIDFFTLILICGGAVYGWSKKLTGQLASLVGFLLAIIICRMIGSGLADALVSKDASPSTRLLETMLVYVAIGAIVYIVVHVVSGVLKATVKALHMGIIDRIGGSVFTVFEWLVGFSLLLNLWMGIFKDSELNSNHEGFTACVVDLGPKVIGSETAQQIFSTIQTPKTLNQHGDNNGESQPSE